MVDFVDFLYEESVFWLQLKILVMQDFSHGKSINICHHNICSEASRLRDFEMKNQKNISRTTVYNPINVKYCKKAVMFLA
jgi:hypothetical protein